MTFLHAAFLGGILTVVVPIVMHLMMRQKPRRLEFPALRFVKQRQHANRRQMRLRHWLLLALRCALLALLALALARPSVVTSGLLGDEEAPVAAALVFDTNPRMQYRQQNKTRLEAAQEMALWLLAELPSESDVAVVDSRSASATFAVDLGAARQRVERLNGAAMSQPLTAAIESAIQLLGESDKPRKELYVFTDLTRAAWPADAMDDLDRRLKELAGTGMYVIDVGVEKPSNFGLAGLQLSGQVLAKNSPLVLDADLVHTGEEGDRSVELYLVDPESRQAAKRGQQQVALAPDASEKLTFSVLGLAPGLHQGYLKIIGEDALACDDTLWFTVDVRAAWRVLIAAPRDSDREPKDYAFFLSEALAPYEFRLKGREAFQCELIALDELASKPLDGYSAVCLVDPRPQSPAVWQRLHSYVAGGGGLGIFLGRNATPIDSFNDPAAQQLLPGKLVRQWRAPGTSAAYLTPEHADHAMLAKFRGLEVAWEGMPVFRHWQLDNFSEGAGIVFPLSDGQPAILERPVGRGRVVTMTTPISDAANRPAIKGYEAWNLLPIGEERWPFVALANEMMRYLVGSGQERLNYPAGDTAVVRFDDAQRPSMVSLSTPRGDQIRTPVDEKKNAISVTSTEIPGNYRVQAGGGNEAVDLGFSVNYPPQVSQLERVNEADLKTMLAGVPLRRARNRDEVDRTVSLGRSGRELFPYLIILLTIILGCEQVLANRFYQDYDTQEKASRAAELASHQSVASRNPRSAPVKSS
jgi:hypothetical protein